MPDPSAKNSKEIDATWATVTGDTPKPTVPRVDSATFWSRLGPCARQAAPLALAWAVLATACRAPFFLLLSPQEPSPIGLMPIWSLLATFVISLFLAIAVLATRSATFPDGAFPPTLAGVAGLVRNDWKPLVVASAIVVPGMALACFWGLKTGHEAGYFFIGSLELFVAMMLADLQPVMKADGNAAQGVSAK